MLRRQGLAVDRMHQHHLGTVRIGRRKAALVELVDAALHAAVEAGEYDLASALAQAGLGEDGPQGRAGPLSCPHRLTQPGLAHRPRRETSAAVAGALERDGDRGLRARLDVVQAQAQRTVDMAADRELPGARVDHWDVEVDQQIVQADRRDRVVQRLERHRVIAHCELVWIAAAATGLAALLAASSDALTVLRYGGAAYLIYLGVQRWRQSEKVESPQPAPLGRIFAQGFLTQILNPKVAVFALAFLPLFLDPGMPVLPQVAVLGAVYMAIALVVDFSYVLGVGALSKRLLSSRIAQRRAGRVAAGTYVALGVVAAVSGERLTR